MYTQLKTAVCNNSKKLLRYTLNSSRYSSCFEMLVPCPHFINSTCLYQSLRTKHMQLGMSSINHNKFLLQNHCKHVRKCVVAINNERYILKRSFHHTSKNCEKERKLVPKLLYMQNPLTWLVNKLDFGMLRRGWDPQFDESEFRRGTKQAVSTVTKFISQNLFISLKGLLTNHALTVLQRDVETTWSDEQRRHIGLDPGDIQLAIPRRVHFQRIVEQKFCDVDMVFIALKWAEHGGASAIIFVEIIARFHREYSEGCLPDWTVSLFRVTRFSILPR